MIIERILQLIEYKGISKRKFYVKTGLSNGFLDKQKDLGVNKVVNILHSYPEINPVWLLTGDGEMLKKNQGNSTQTIKNRNGIISQVTNNSRDTSVERSDSLELLQNKVEHLTKENEQLKKSLEDKEEIIRLLKR